MCQIPFIPSAQFIMPSSLYIQRCALVRSFIWHFRVPGCDFCTCTLTETFLSRSRAMWYVLVHTGAKYIENNTWERGDPEFLFECSTRYLTSERSEQVRYRVEHEKRSSISPSNHVLVCLLYKHLTNKKKPT